MALHLKDLIAKAESKGIKAKEDPPILAGFLKPWQEESILFNKTDEALTLDEKNIQKKDITIKKRKISQNKEKNRQQTDNKLITNRQQSGNKTDNKLITNRQQENIVKTKNKQTGNKVEAQPATEPATRLSSSSSIYNNKTTTIELPKEWIEIDISSLEDIGFSQNHLIQLFKIETFTTQSVKDSIEHFAFDLKNNNKLREIKTNPLSYFMGILKRSGIYTAPENYESPRDRAMRLYLAKQKEIKQKRETMENELFDLAFSDWEAKLGEEERSHIIPEEVKKMKFRGASLSALKEYFRESMWPEERVKIEVENLKEN